VVSQARTLDRFIAPAQERLWSLARNLWWSWDHNPPACFALWTPRAGGN
jgi:glycogen phosphorylase